MSSSVRFADVGEEVELSVQTPVVGVGCQLGCRVVHDAVEVGLVILTNVVQFLFKVFRH